MVPFPKQHDEIVKEYISSFNTKLEEAFFSSSSSADCISSMMRRLLATGQSMGRLLTILQCAALRLTVAEPYIAYKLVQESVSQMVCSCSMKYVDHILQSPPTLAQQLQGAPKAELFLTIAIHRASQKLKNKRKLASTSDLSSAVAKRQHSSSSSAIAALCMCSAGDVIKEFDAVSGLLRKKSLTRRAVMTSLQALADANVAFLSNNSTGPTIGNRRGNTITDSTMVALIPTTDELCEAFCSKDLRIPDKMRRAAVDVAGTVLINGEVLSGNTLLE